MLNIVRRGTTAELNALNLESGELAFNTDDGSLRAYDGETLGGWAFQGSPVEFPPPGPQTLIGGDTTAGFYGETSTTELISGVDLASALGLSAGGSQNTDSPWLKFALDGKTLFVAKKSLRYGISWDEINAANAVYGDVTVSISGCTYKVRLLKGANSDPTVRGADGAWTGYDIDLAVGSEWNRLMYHVSDGVFAQGSGSLTSEGITVGDWAQYTEGELLTHRSYGNGTYCWCQEVSGDGAGYRVGRGYNGVSYLGRFTSSYSYTRTGWRPVLELVES